MTEPPLPFSAQAVERAAEHIRAGRIVAVPTETVYGLAGDAGSAEAAARIYAAKGRPGFNPLIVHVPGAEEAGRLAVLGDEALALARAFWPGPLTMVLPRRPDAPLAGAVTAGLDTVAIRAPAHRAMRALLAACGRPLAAPSANRSNGISPTRAEHVVASLEEAAPLVLDDGPSAAGLESTIVARLARGWSILRPGPVTDRMLADVVSLTDERPAGITAPGQLARHYAPAKPLRLDATAAREGEWMIGYGAIMGDDTLSAAGDSWEAAARLFDCLHRADASGRAAIAVAPVPRQDVGAAVNDRLARAAAR